MALVIGVIIGRITAPTIQDQKENRQTRANVTVVGVRGDNSYSVRFDNDDHQCAVKPCTYQWQFCNDSSTDFKAGQKFEYITYDQRKGCKSLNGSTRLEFKMYTDARTGDRITFPIEKEIAGE